MSRGDTQQRAIESLRRDRVREAQPCFTFPVTATMLQELPTTVAIVGEILGAFERVFLPDVARSEGDLRRFNHADLYDLTDAQLWQEGERAKWLLAWSDDPHPWTGERLKRLKAEERRRGR